MSARNSPLLPPLGRNDVHVWRVPLLGDDAEAFGLEAALTDVERERAARFHFDEHRHAYRTSHAVLRRLLAGYLQRDSYRAPFLVGAHGKPRLGSGGGLRFNLAHSGALALVAVADGFEIGVDVEQVTARPALEAVAEDFFSEPERRALAELPPDRRRDAFFQVWAQKEAYLKGRGDGVSGGLDHFDVEVDPEKPSALLADRKDPQATTRWKLHTLRAGDSYRAALAVEHASAGIRCFDWPGWSDVSPG